jgi:cholesterol oxidase
VWLKLTRYRGGDKGPVLVAPGFAMASSQFLLTTTEQNLTEHLTAAGYDVWLFDYRSSIDLESARSDHTLDDVALRDWPTAIAEVRARTGAADVQIVAHCLGSMTALMAVLGGAEGVRSIVSSQVTLHPVMHWFSRLKAAIHLPNLLQDMGIRTVEYDLTPTIADRVLDVVLRLNPLLKDETCSNPSCRWVFGFFGPTHVHDQLDAETHAATTRLFGVGDLRALAQTGVIVRKGHVVDHTGFDSYLPMVERLDLPITFLAGARNRLFEPATSLRTYEWLRQHHDPNLYERIVLPDYAHLDGLIGTRAHLDVFPLITAALAKHDAVAAARATTPAP